MQELGCYYQTIAPGNDHPVALNFPEAYLKGLLFRNEAITHYITDLNLNRDVVIL
jgi:hypothetical protein